MKKQEILNQLMDKVEQVKRGQVSALDVYPELNELSKSVDELRKELYDYVIEEAEKYDDKEDIIRRGYKISIQRRMYPQYSQDDEYAFINEKLKARKKLIKTATKKGRPLTDSETGETVTPVDAKYRMFPKCEWIGEQL